MTMQYATDVVNAMLDAMETTIGTAPTLELRTGAKPTDCTSADSGTVVATMTLPSDWMASASARTKGLAGIWQDTSADNAGTVGHFRLKAGGACKIQGSVTATGGGGDMTVDNPTLTAGQSISITAFNQSGPAA